jgi:hypothetical protein
VEKRLSQDPRLLIRDLQLEARRLRERPEAQFHELARRRIDAPQEILDWAKRDRRWSFTLAEVMNDPVARPHELAARLLLAIVDELEEERQVLDLDVPETSDDGNDPRALHAE